MHFRKISLFKNVFPLRHIFYPLENFTRNAHGCECPRQPFMVGLQYPNRSLFKRVDDKILYSNTECSSSSSGKKGCLQLLSCAINFFSEAVVHIKSHASSKISFSFYTIFSCICENVTESRLPQKSYFGEDCSVTFVKKNI